jgi:plastocyanin
VLTLSVHTGGPVAPPSVARANVPVAPAWANVPRRPFSPKLVLAAIPRHPVAGSAVQLVVVDPPAGATDFHWSLGRNTKGSCDTGSAAWITHTYATGGVRHVHVRFTDGPTTRLASLELTVGPKPAPRSAVLRPPHPPNVVIGDRAARATRQARVASLPAHGVRAEAAADPALTIADFHFTPSTITVHVGESITWTNDGPSTHTATARDGSFNTGQLKKGQSASHTFTQAGTFAYYCQIHPFMHGTIVVLAAPSPATPSTTPPSASSSTTTPSPATTGATTTGSTGSSTAAPSAEPATVARATLPVTGLDVSEALTIGLVLIGVGLTLYRATRARRG